MFRENMRPVAKSLYYLFAIWSSTRPLSADTRVKSVPMPPAIPLSPIARSLEIKRIIMSINAQERPDLIMQLLANKQLTDNLIDAKSQILHFVRSPYDPLTQAGIKQASRSLGQYINTIVPKLSQKEVGADEMAEAFEHCFAALLTPIKSLLNTNNIIMVLGKRANT